MGSIFQFIPLVSCSNKFCYHLRSERFSTIDGLAKYWWTMIAKQLNESWLINRMKSWCRGYPHSTNMIVVIRPDQRSESRIYLASSTGLQVLLWHACFCHDFGLKNARPTPWKISIAWHQLEICSPSKVKLGHFLIVDFAWFWRVIKNISWMKYSSHEPKALPSGIFCVLHERLEWFLSLCWSIARNDWDYQLGLVVPRIYSHRLR
jgi:hypothetical protein